MPNDNVVERNELGGKPDRQCTKTASYRRKDVVTRSVLKTRTDNLNSKAAES